MKKIINSFVGYLNVTPQMLTEAESQGKSTVTVQGVIQRADAENQNERIYPKPVLEREVKKFQEKISQGMSGGELDHPDDPVVNLRNVSHVMKEVWWEGNNVMGLVEILNTPSGNIAKELIKGGIRLGISSRGMGSTINEGNKVLVDDDFDLVTWDLVSNPSTHGAFLNPINESVSHSKNKRADIDKLIVEILNIKI